MEEIQGEISKKREAIMEKIKSMENCFSDAIDNIDKNLFLEKNKTLKKILPTKRLNT